MFLGTAQVSHQVCQFFVSSMCLLVHVTMVDKDKAVVCCLLSTSAIILSEKKKRKRKTWSKKWYLKRNISCDAQFYKKKAAMLSPFLMYQYICISNVLLRMIHFSNRNVFVEYFVYIEINK